MGRCSVARGGRLSTARVAKHDRAPFSLYKTFTSAATGTIDAPTDRTLLNYDPPGGGNNCGVVTTPTTSNPATFLQLVASTSTNEQFVLGRAVAASLLNAATYGSNYPVTAHSIVAMFNATFGGGTYQVTTGVFWNRARVIEYLTSLYPAT